MSFGNRSLVVLSSLHFSLSLLCLLEGGSQEGFQRIAERPFSSDMVEVMINNH